MNGLRSSGNWLRTGRAVFLTLVVIPSLFPDWLSAQSPPTEESAKTISGTVINAVTRAPIPRALVSTPDNRYAMFTDGAGHFEFDVAKENVGAPEFPGQIGNLMPSAQFRTWVNAITGALTLTNARIVGERVCARPRVVAISDTLSTTMSFRI